MCDGECPGHARSPGKRFCGQRVVGRAWQVLRRADQRLSRLGPGFKSTSVKPTEPHCEGFEGPVVGPSRAQPHESGGGGDERSAPLVAALLAIFHR